ncbi:uncharacterized protein LOC125168360 [Prionailurus viverrinus]|uniref:uncharacterized protein LOC125168360 n=1 Tax=Prionailurus viverrinus TaxID=61388 RepID=UPI001FF1ED9C|nr:uncharacterized protein LOC125168360 [Prionailurus viverrinus]
MLYLRVVKGAVNFIVMLLGFGVDAGDRLLLVVFFLSKNLVQELPVCQIKSKQQSCVKLTAKPVLKLGAARLSCPHITSERPLLASGVDRCRTLLCHAFSNLPLWGRSGPGWGPRGNREGALLGQVRGRPALLVFEELLGLFLLTEVRMSLCREGRSELGPRGPRTPDAPPGFQWRNEHVDTRCQGIVVWRKRFRFHLRNCCLSNSIFRHKRSAE